MQRIKEREKKEKVRLGGICSFGLNGQDDYCSISDLISLPLELSNDQHWDGSNVHYRQSWSEAALLLLLDKKIFLLVH